MTIESPFGYGEVVYLTALNVTATVFGILFDANGLQFHIYYWYDGKRCTEWVFSTEIKKDKSNETISGNGFRGHSCGNG